MHWFIDEIFLRQRAPLSICAVWGEVLKLMELTGLGDGIQELEKCCRIPCVLRVSDITDEPAL